MNSGIHIPGYTGYVPFKSEFIGSTTGVSNRAAEQVYRAYARDAKSFSRTGEAILALQNEGEVLSRSNTVNNNNQSSHLKKMIGNRSKESVTWINGPMHEVRNQCIPCYTGHIEGVKSENVFGQTFARSSASSFDRAIVKGRDATNP